MSNIPSSPKEAHNETQLKLLHRQRAFRFQLHQCHQFHLLSNFYYFRNSIPNFSFSLLLFPSSSLDILFSMSEKSIATDNCMVFVIEGIFIQVKKINTQKPELILIHFYSFSFFPPPRLCLLSTSSSSRCLERLRKGIHSNSFSSGTERQKLIQSICLHKSSQRTVTFCKLR